ncbi:MAG: VCBS repeat-containing protein [Bacteroidia bacterium]|nr:VCBS repeat-containing protein [Bacteroidia bacterium]
MFEKLIVLLLFLCSSPSLWAQGSKGKLFDLLSPKKTGIHFSNDLTDTPTDNILIYSNFYGGAGVGLGDINNDGLLDVFFAGNQVADKLYLNKGDMQFEDITESAGILDDGAWSSSVIFGDVNQDGWEDIYVTRELYDDKPELRRNLLYLNQGNNSFKEVGAAYGVADSQRTRNATFLDYDKDGDLDLFLCNQPPNPGDYSKFYKTELLLEQYSVRLYENTGGKFQDVTKKAGLNKTGFPNSVSATDFNNDGWIDLYVANDFWAGDWLFLNKGDGSFENVIDDAVKHISFSSMGVDAADINNDGLTDIMVLDMAAEDNYRSKANMSGMNPQAFWKVVKDGGHHQYMFNTLQLNRNGKGFSDIAQLAGISNTDWSWANLIADFDNDGWKDIYVTNGLMRDIRNNDAAKLFKNHVESSLYKYIQKNQDLEGKSVWDIVDINETLALVPSEKLSNYIYQNQGKLTFAKKMQAWGLDQKSFSNGAAYGDLDNDGDLDLVVSNVNDKAFVYENQATSSTKNNYLRIRLHTDKGLSLEGSKIWIKTQSGEQHTEIAGSRGMYSSSERIAHFGLGTNMEIEELHILWMDGTESLLENVKPNQELTISYKSEKRSAQEKARDSEPLLTNISGKYGLNFVHRENPFDDYEMQVLLPHKMSGMGPCIATGDINNDGLEDFFVGGAAGVPGNLYTQMGNGSFLSLPQDFLAEDRIHEDLGALFVDVDGDDDQDLYVVSGGNEFPLDSKYYQDRLYLNNGKGIFTKASDLLPNMKFSGSKVYPEDFDKDGDIDLFVGGRHIPGAYPEAASSVLLRNDGGRFTDVTAELFPDLNGIGMLNDASWVDHDGDGWKDLILVGEWMPISIYSNKEGRFEKFEAKGLEFSEGWWFSIESADIDQDGDMDMIVGNLGLNYKYKASVEEPFGVYYYDFDESGTKDIVLSYYNFGVEFPLRGRECSSQQVPEIKAKFETYDLFAGSDLVQIYGEDNLETSLHYEAYTFASLYIENKGNGRFETHQLPIEAQFSSVNDIIIKDMNQDEHLDVLLAGNLFDAEVETTRNDAGMGVLLLGNGKGDFRNVSPTESGIYLPYDVKSLAEIRSNNKSLILVGCNNGPMQTLELQTITR